MSRNERLRRQRVLRNWRQQDVADQIGVSIVTYQRWERGNQQPSAYYRIKLCSLFDASPQELGLVEDALPTTPEDSPTPAPEAAPASTPERNERLTATPSAVAPGEESMLWTVPYTRNPYFTGREEILAQLEQQFTVSNETDPHQPTMTQLLALTGLGGIGKTQIAVEYAYRARIKGLYTHTIWINAASEESILTDFISLATQLPSFKARNETDQRQLVAEIIRWFEYCEQPWLLIVDNVDDLSFIYDYLPRRGNGNILLTTRASAVGSLTIPITLETMSVEEGTRFLLRRARRPHTLPEEVAEAEKIVVALGQFPLALDQAGAYIEETASRFCDYRLLYEQHRHALLSRRGWQSMRYPESVATTWSLSFQRIEQVNPAAAELLNLCAFLSPDDIPEELLINGASQWPPALQKAVSDLFTFNQMLEELLSFSLVKRLAEHRLLSLHRLVQVVVRARLSQQEQRLWTERIVRAVWLAFPDDPKDNVAVWRKCQRNMAQVQALDTLVQQYQLFLPEAAEMFDRTATYLGERAMYRQAETFNKRAIHIWEQLAGPDHYLKLVASLNGLSQLYYEQGKYAEAEPLRQRALHILEQQVTTPQPSLLTITLHGLGFLYSEQGRYAEAEPLYQRALQIWEKQVGSEQPPLAYLLHGLGFLYAEQGRFTEAEPLYLRALRIREQLLGPEHLRTAYTLNALALLYTQQGRYSEAESLYQRALRIREQQLGPEHMKTGIILNGLGLLYYKQGKYVEAELFYQRALHIWEQQVQSAHPQVAITLNGLANIYHTQGKDAEAERLYQRALQIHESYLTPQHYKTACVLYDFARFQQDRGCLAEAELLYQQALEIQQHVFGPDHPATIATSQRLHATETALDQNKETL
ncbi:FxSxx-COOH system tetratricopeptide repeat protein [Dictyobacter aurantiacus]|uniref:Tetratricopeptide repeat protein n=1 Tax=Dictyobacter aurantiacus TaxID=1936993 RepID=A0A401ZIW5_9CHLR|nr:FxSxx-COOH system tetratricopeptide repeat protein [Dictyobacter aurantiacus]GCE06796.1 tetratricopeptide repeat protein [Dictyobacter aurantiacus]